MSGFLRVLLMSILLGAASYGVGVLPLSVALSKPSLAKVSAIGNGLLLGAALGVIIPEGIETLVESGSISIHEELPTTIVALSLIAGFTFMLLVEQIHSPHAHEPSARPPSSPARPSNSREPSEVGGTIEFHAELELEQLERAEGVPAADAPSASASTPSRARRGAGGRTRDVLDRLGVDGDAAGGEDKARAYPLTLGLVMHALADGLALGSSALSEGNGASTDTGITAGGAGTILPSGMSVVVFFALIIHKMPTVLALTTSLLSTSLSRSDCKKHIATFSASTPLGALASYVLLTWFGSYDHSRVPGIAMLISGGTFLYVATVLRPVHGRTGDADIGKKTRVSCTVVGIFVPVAIGSLVGHDHGHSM